MKLKGTRHFSSSADAVMYRGVNTAKAATATMRESTRFAMTTSYTFLPRGCAAPTDCAARVPRRSRRKSARGEDVDGRCVSLHAEGCVDLHSAVWCGTPPDRGFRRPKRFARRRHSR